MQENQDDEFASSAIYLPEEEEFKSIVRQAVMESRLYEPFMLLERRVLSTIIIQTKKDALQMVTNQTLHNMTEPTLP